MARNVSGDYLLETDHLQTNSNGVQYIENSLALIYSATRS